LAVVVVLVGITTGDDDEDAGGLTVEVDMVVGQADSTAEELADGTAEVLEAEGLAPPPPPGTETWA
jgi:hypothetical protein